ncbi:MAG: GNAT family N-acetyltransferase [Candidatus Limnocylindrales bacterium]
MGSGDGAGANDIEIRPVTLDDLEVLIDIYLETARHHAAIEPAVFQVPDRADAGARLRRRIDARGETSEYVAAILDGRMVGSATINFEDRPGPGSMMVPVRQAEFGVSVVDGYRGRGIGRAVIGHLEAWAVERGAERILLNVAEANVDAIRLYHALGYVEYDRAMRKDVRTDPKRLAAILED